MHIAVFTTLEGQTNVILASFGRSKIATAYKSHSTEKKIEQKITTSGQKDRKKLLCKIWQLYYPFSIGLFI